MTASREGPSGLLLFFFFALAITWTALLPFAILPPDVYRRMIWLLPLLLVAKFGPSLAGVLMTARAEGAGGVENLFLRLIPTRAATPWALFGLVAPLAAAFGATAILVAGGTPVGPRDPGAFVSFFPALAQRAILGGGLGEELGWRGFALPRLQASLGPVLASLVLGAIWAVWHLPAFLLEGNEKANDSFLLFLGVVLAFSVVFTWVYNRSGGNLFVCVLLHASVNAAESALEMMVPVLWAGGELEPLLAALWGAFALALIAGTRGQLGAIARSV